MAGFVCDVISDMRIFVLGKFIVAGTIVVDSLSTCSFTVNLVWLVRRPMQAGASVLLCEFVRFTLEL